MKNNRALAALALTIGLLTNLAGCPTQPGDPPAGTGNGTLKPFASASEFASYIRRTSPATTYDAFTLEAGAPTPAAAADGTDDTANFTGTNLQEAGVDESDVVKTDGQRLYVASENTLRIIEATGVPRELSRLDLDHAIRGLFLNADELLVVSTEFSSGGGGPEILIWPPYYRDVRLHLTRVSISDPAAPRVLESTTLDGSLVSARLTNGRLIVVLTFVPAALPGGLFATGPTEAQFPQQRVAGQAIGRLVSWENTLRPDDPDGAELTVAVAFDARALAAPSSRIGVMSRAAAIYATQNAVYLAAQPVYDETGVAQTWLHKLSISPAGELAYVASGAVPGTLLNQFSLSEFEGRLRVALSVTPPLQTFTDGDTVSVEVPPTSLSSTSVAVLEQADNALRTVGRVDGIAPGERMYAARFLGSRGFLVTFEQVDPLFSLDLSDPAAPRVVGELKVPGFSDYLHPLGADRLIGVGRSTRTQPGGFVTVDGVQLSLFDVAMPETPRSIQQLTFGRSGSWTEVSGTHKAFSIRASDSRLLIPMTLYKELNSSFGATDLEFDGVICFDVQPDVGFSERARVALAGANQYASWRRGILIDERVYAVSDRGVRLLNLEDSSGGELLFNP